MSRITVYRAFYFDAGKLRGHANYVWEGTELQAACGTRENPSAKLKDRAREHLINGDPTCLCGIHGYFDPVNVQFDYEDSIEEGNGILARAVLGGVVGIYELGARGEYAVSEGCRLWLLRNMTGLGLNPLVSFDKGLSYQRVWRGDDTLVTVYIPTFNRLELLLDRALPSVRAQTYENLEIIVAAHGCTDATLERVDAIRYLADPRIRLLNVPRKQTYPPTAENHWYAGPVAPCNAALKEASGDWIARLDDDDTWTEDHIAKLLRFAQDGNYEFVSSAYEVEKIRHGRAALTEIIHDDGAHYGYPGVAKVGGVQTWLYRSYLRFMRYNPDCWRKSWNRVNDTDLVDRFRKAGVRIGHLDEVTVIIKPRPGEIEIGLKAYQSDEAGKIAHFAF